MNRKKIATFAKLKSLIMDLEGFSPKPYWDRVRWSWGYGTRVPDSIDDPQKKPDKEITKTQALIDMVAHFMNDWKVLQPLLKVQLTEGQQAALLSFSYNAGVGAGKKLVAVINEKDAESIEYKMKAYNKSRNDSGVLVVDPVLVKRRVKEWETWIS